MPKALTELTTREVSLVTRGAVNKRFAIKKEDAMDQILKAVLEQEAEGEAAALAALEKSDMSPKGREAMKGIIRLYSAFRDEIPAELAKAAPKMAGYASDSAQDDDAEDDKLPSKKAKAKKADADMDEDADADEDKKFPPSKKKSKAEKSADMPSEFRSQFEAVAKAQQEAVEKAERLEKALETERDVRLTREFVEKAQKEFATIGPASEVGAVLKSLHGLGSELAGKVEKLLKSAAARADNASLFGQRGRDASLASGGGNTAWDRIEKAAVEMINKSADGSKLSKSEAIDIVMKRQPELYEEYRAEHNNFRVGGR